ncbi:MAG TPA: DUF1841 family protein [Burkholderiales bacterium]|nr:DUF1841 family protein [Betaproteobacteria bacterium]HQR52996.1 DUF1841 family protein [Burkholderiales bacterium]
MFSPSREQARRFFFDTWAKHCAGVPLEGLETTALAVILLHPEYQPLLADRERNLDRDFGPEQGSLNPFLHLSLHLAIEEQLSIDQPPGIAVAYRALVSRCGDEHDARHAVLECLGEVIWNAQRNGTVPDGAAYLRCIAQRAGASHTR